ncbi:hypothetical protein JVU11DRAFT_7409 [Chiua virens]|nr:hypothetical protein JVU11DRAFT_7409 [Chiua virens]
MSAYGALLRPARSSYLPSTTWPHPRDPHAVVTLFHIDSSMIADGDRHPGLFDYLHAVFAGEVDKGLTYPQEDMHDPAAFRAYFFAADVVIAIVGDRAGITPDPLVLNDGLSTRQHDDDALPAAPAKRAAEATVGVGVEVDPDLEMARAGRSWDACVVGFYYVKPNYPGRSSHICNAGFVVPPSHRAGGYGRVLARSYLHYAPRLGYKASVFNLVYVNNVASVRLWEKLGFVKAGLIPKAGRLRRADGPGEEYIDAWVFYKSFEEGPGDGSVQLSR